MGEIIGHLPVAPGSTHHNLVARLDSSRPLGSRAIVGRSTSFRAKLQHIDTPPAILEPSTASVRTQQRLGDRIVVMATIGAIRWQNHLHVVIDRGDGWHAARLEVDRDDVWDLVADVMDPHQALFL